MSIFGTAFSRGDVYVVDRLTGESLAASGPVELPASSEVGYTLDDVGNRLTRTSSVPGVSGQVYHG